MNSKDQSETESKKLSYKIQYSADQEQMELQVLDLEGMFPLIFKVPELGVKRTIIKTKSGGIQMI